MKSRKESIRKIVSFLNNEDEDGGYWLPNIQRPFVWSEGQICKLFDSIMRQYPISTLLIWKTKSDIRCRKFIDNWADGMQLRLSQFYVSPNKLKKCLVLDGQQRLQSLMIGLNGSYDGRELYLNLLSGEVVEPDDTKYRFAFLPADKAAFPWAKLKDLVRSSARLNYQLVADVAAGAGRALTPPEHEKVSRHIELAVRSFTTEDGIAWQELDSIENPDLYAEDDVVEIFIRANSGGTHLGKSDLLFSLLASSWEDANDEMEQLLESLNRHGFAFTRDFVLKTCLTLLDRGARYEVDKFRKAGVRELIEENWSRIADAITSILDFVRGKTFIKSDKAIPSYLALIPLIYACYHYPAAWKKAHDIDSYLLRTLLVGAFSGTPDQLIDECVRKIKEQQDFDVKAIFGVIRTAGRSLDLTEERLWEMGYRSDTVHLLFNLWYREFNYTPAYEGNMPQIDHIFPQSALKKVKEVNPTTNRRDLMKYRQSDRDQLANCMLLSAEENGAGGKSDILPQVWFADKDPKYLDMHLIPKDQELWKIENFERFVEVRKSLIRDKFKHLLVPKGTQRRPI